MNRIAEYFDGRAWTPRQPAPLLTTVSRLTVGGRTVTAIVRAFEYDQVARCKLCPAGQCCSTGGECLVLVNQDVPDQAAPLFKIEGPRA